MAKSVYVAGPSATPGLVGSPAQYLQQINQVRENMDKNQRFQQELEQEKLFKQQAQNVLEQGQALAEQKQAYVEAEPQRIKDANQELIDRETGLLGRTRDMAQGLQYAGLERGEGLKKLFLEDPRFANLDQQGKDAAWNKYALSSPEQLTSPALFKKNLTKQLEGYGEYTAAEIDAAASRETAQRYGTGADPKIIEKQLLKPSDIFGSGQGSTNIQIGRDGATYARGSSGNWSPVTDMTNPDQRSVMAESLSKDLGITKKNPSTWWDAVPIIGGERVEWEGGTLNATQGDIARVFDRAANGGVTSPTAARAAIQEALNDDKEFKEGWDPRTKEGMKNIIDLGLKTQEHEGRLYNKKTGGGQLSAAEQAAQGGQLFSPIDKLNATAQYNQNLTSLLSPQAFTDAQVTESFLNSIAPPPKKKGDKKLLEGTGDKTGGKTETATPEELAKAELAAEKAAEKAAGEGKILTNAEAAKRAGVGEGIQRQLMESFAKDLGIDFDDEALQAAAAQRAQDEKSEFQVGGPLFGGQENLSPNNVAMTGALLAKNNPISQAVMETGSALKKVPGLFDTMGEAKDRFLETLTPPGPSSVMNFKAAREGETEKAIQTIADAKFASPGRERFELLMSAVGAGPSRQWFEEKLNTDEKHRWYQKSLDPKTPRAEAIRIWSALGKGKTPRKINDTF